VEIEKQKLKTESPHLEVRLLDRILKKYVTIKIQNVIILRYWMVLEW